MVGVACLTRCWVLRVHPRERVDLMRALPGHELSPHVVWGGRDGVGGVAGRMLRTTQWTRASLWLKFLRAHGGCLGTRNRRRT